MKFEQIIEILAMKDLNNKSFKVKLLFILLFLSLFLGIFTGTATAKSLYVLADINADPQPLQAYDIGIDGSLTFQSECMIPVRVIGAVGLAADSDSKYLFVTYEASRLIQLVNLETMTLAGTASAPGASNLAGIVYDHDKKLLYCVDRNKGWLYAFNWDSDIATLSPLSGLPFYLRRATAYGIALDEKNDLLYVANATKEIYVYSTSDWSLIKTITLSRDVVNVALDVSNDFLYAGGGYVGNCYLTQYDLNDNTEEQVQVEHDAGVMGLGVDPASGYIYMSTGNDSISGGDNLLVYNSSLRLIDIVENIGNPTGLVIPGKDVGFSPLNLRKSVSFGAFGGSNDSGYPETNAGSSVTYTIEFDNVKNEDTATNVVVTDYLPSEVDFIAADEDGFYGTYNSADHTYTWIYPSIQPGLKVSLEITVQVKHDISPNTIIENSATIKSDQTPTNTSKVSIITANDPLHIKKSVAGTSLGENKLVEPDELVTYRIHFDNNENNFTARDVLIVDYLPEEVSFVRADYHMTLGYYDSTLHAYMWYYPPLEPGSATRVEITVRINSDVVPGTVITNTAVIDSSETSESSSSVDIVVAGEVNQFNLTKSVVGSSGEMAYVAVDIPFTYNILFDTYDMNTPANNITVVDTMPEELIFISADGEGDFGQYDKESNMFTWSFASLEPGQAVSLNLTAKIREGVALGKTITNTVIIDCDETPKTSASANVSIDLGGLAAESIQFVPDTIRRKGTLTGLIAVMVLPEIIKLDDIKDEPFVLYPGNLKATNQQMTERNGKVQIVAVFDKNELMNSLVGYGLFELEVIGKLKSDQSFYGQAFITVTRFAAN
ncbi:isopeptide-forming domain-containing fimbrial protein [Planctomycetota bacterium]